ncbi:hypothetical protein [Flectobacillus rivi]|uniref:Outer membrane protein beta-barrel domain-containing protein n=1 Tax=Flectobacillus rivi TaxID=2984209 RepID=A0ABT6YW44_9BACT|nr:hypothetical protein [Flectobacillus rivi]MDI9873105.1 hypothetical protein [Flectobacillus rivi]
MKTLQFSLLVISICLLFNFYSFGQYSEGKKYLEGSFNIGTTRLKDYNQNQKDDLSSTLNVTYGKFISKSKARFWTLGFTQSSTDYRFATTYSTNNSNYKFSLGVGNEYYKQIFGNLGIYGRLQGNLYAGNTSQTIYDDFRPSNNEDTNTFSTGVTLEGSGGVSYFVSKKLALVVPIVSSNLFGLDFSQTNSETMMSTSRIIQIRYNISPTIYLNLGIGIRYVF